MPGRPADQATEHIAAAFVGGQDAVADHEGGGADMVRDQADGHILLLVSLILCPGDLTDPVPDGLHGVDVEHGVHVLHHHSQAL